MAFKEIMIIVPIWDLLDDECENSELFMRLCTQLNIQLDTSFLYKTYLSYFDPKILGPKSRIERGDIFILLASSSDDEFIFIDMFRDSLDQMDTIKLAVRYHVLNDKIEGLMSQINLESEIESTIKMGDLNLKWHLQEMNQSEKKNLINPKPIRTVKILRNNTLEKAPSYPHIKI